ncbi:MAG TPA: T9SS type A sorting domain-containing protein [Bacteroidia bacterium]
MKKQVLTLSLFVAGIGAAFSQSTIWQPYNSNIDTSSFVRYLSVVDTNTVWGIGFLGGHTNSNLFTRTIDGANYHSGKVFPDTSKYNIANISAVGTNTAYVAAYYIAGGGPSGKIMKTTNGGATWTNASDSLTMFLGANNFPDWVHFWDANNGIALGDPNGNTTTPGTGMDMFEIYRTHNGGTNWTRVVDANVPMPISGEYGLTNSYTTWKGYIWSGTSDGNQVYASADSGKTWTVNATSLGLAGGINNLAFRDSLNGLAWGLASSSATSTTIMKTADGGATWSTVTSNSMVPTSDISRVPKTKWYLGVGLNGTGSAYVTSITKDDAATWTVLETGTTNPVRMLSVQMLDSMNGWAGNFSTGTLPYGTSGINRFKLGHKTGCPITLTSTSTSTPFNVCHAGTATLTASGLNTYTWSTSANTPSITVTPSVTTTYSVAGTTTAGCANYETFNITVISPTVSVASHTICPGVNITLPAVGANTYSWSPATGLSATTGASVTANPMVTTIYTITGTENLCNATTTATITTKPAPIISIASSTVSLCAGSTATITASGATTYTWSTATTGASITVTPTVNTTYSVTGTGTVNTCTSKAVITQTVTNCVGIEQYSGYNNQVSVYPNPSTGLVTISISNIANGTVMYVTNMLGQEVIKTSIKDVNTNIDLTSLQKGMYMLTITNSESKHIEKLIIQ